MLNLSFLHEFKGETHPARRKNAHFDPLNASCAASSWRPTRRQLLMGSSALGAQLLVPWPARAAGVLLSGNNAHMSRFEGGARLSCDMGEWNIDASRFGGRPRLSSSVVNGQWHLELQGALFPGTGLPADFRARSWREAGVRWLLVEFPSFGFAARVPLEAWLQGRARAVSAAHFDAPRFERGRASQSARRRGSGVLPFLALPRAGAKRGALDVRRSRRFLLVRGVAVVTALRARFATGRASQRHALPF